MNYNLKYFLSIIFIGSFLNLPYVNAQENHSPLIIPSGGVWLKGDLHVHSRHSTESSNHSIAKIINFSKSVKMDYLCITDHDNHVKGDVAHHTWIDPEFKSDSLLLLYGAEWTTTRGHGNVFSAKPYDHQRLFDARDLRDVNIAKIKKPLNIHLSANHPSGKDNFGFSYDLVQSIEVWNSAMWTKNANAMMIWDDMLSSGRMMTGRGGSDAHHGTPTASEKPSENSYQAAYNYIGTPTTWVFAKERSLSAIVDALSHGKVAVSANPFSPRVEFYADFTGTGKFDMMMGDNAVSKGKPVTFQIQLTGNILPNETYTITVIKNGSKLNTYQIKDATPVVNFVDTPALNGRTYYRVMVEGKISDYPQVPKSMALSERMVSLSNPIYFNFDPKF